MREQWPEADRPLRVLSVDPGRDKCGVAVVDSRDGVLARGIVPTRVVGAVVRDWVYAHRPARLLLGRGTFRRPVRAVLDELDLPLEVVPEVNTTRRARERYFQENPPRGWRRFIPAGLRSLPVP